MTQIWPDTPREDKNLYTKQLKDDKMVGYYILASMSCVLQYQYDSFKTASEIIYNLKEMFGD